MRAWSNSWVAVVLLLIAARTAAAQSPKLRESGNPGLLRINSAVAGSQPTPVSDATTTLDVRAGGNGGAKKVAAQLNTPMPTGVTLTLTMSPPPGATGLGAVALTTTPRDLVVNIPQGSNTTQSMSYTLSASVTAGVIPASSRTVTLTLLNYP